MNYENKTIKWKPLSEYNGGRVLATNDLDLLIGEINSDGDCADGDGCRLCGITAFANIDDVIPKPKNITLLEEVKNYLENTSPEQLEQDWKEMEQFDDCSPLVKDFIKNKNIKNYADIEQSKKLAEILPFKSADGTWMPYTICGDALNVPEEMQYIHQETPFRLYSGIGVPCWSLAALLELLPNEISTDDSFVNHYQIDIRKHDWYDNTTLYQIAYGNDRGSSGEWSDMINTGQKENLIDCCVQMILRLNELKLV